MNFSYISIKDQFSVTPESKSPHEIRNVSEYYYQAIADVRTNCIEQGRRWEGLLRDSSLLLFLSFVCRTYAARLLTLRDSYYGFFSHLVSLLQILSFSLARPCRGSKSSGESWNVKTTNDYVDA